MAPEEAARAGVAAGLDRGDGCGLCDERHGAVVTSGCGEG